MSSRTVFVGMDGSQDTLDVAMRPTAEPWQVAHEAAERSPRVAQLEAMAPALVVLDATGGFAGPLLAALAVAAVPVVRATPRQGRACAPAVGRLATTARMDARVLAHFAAAGKPVPRPLPEAAPQELRAVLRRRRPVVERLTAERHRLGMAPPACTRRVSHTARGWKGTARQPGGRPDPGEPAERRRAGHRGGPAKPARCGAGALAAPAGAGPCVRPPGTPAERSLGRGGPLQLREWDHARAASGVGWRR